MGETAAKGRVWLLGKRGNIWAIGNNWVLALGSVSVATVVRISIEVLKCGRVIVSL
jgi:hypothetical protein